MLNTKHVWFYLLIPGLFTFGCLVPSKQILFVNAVVQGQKAKALEFIGDNEIDVNSQNGDFGPVLLAVSQDGNNEMVEFLINNGANINIQDKYNGYTPLMCAVIAEKADTVILLLAKGADPSLITKNGKKELTAHDFALLKGNQRIIEIVESKK